MAIVFRRFSLAVAAVAAARGAQAASAPRSQAVFHPGPATGVAGYLIVAKSPFAPPSTDEVRRVQACKDAAVRQDPALDAPAGAAQVSKLINQCLGPGSAVFTLPWLGNTPINTYLE